jgi:DNA replication factor Dna2
VTNTAGQCRKRYELSHVKPKLTFKRLFLELDKSNSPAQPTQPLEPTKQVLLRQSWFDTPCTTGSFVHVFGQFDHQSICIIDNSENMIILHPDHLVSATVVADAFGCMRRAVLQDRVKATGSSSAPMLYGTLLHEIFQEAMKLNSWDLNTLRHLLDGILPRHFESIVDVGLELNQMHEYLIPKLMEMGAWAAKFIRQNPSVSPLQVVPSNIGSTKPWLDLEMANKSE